MGDTAGISVSGSPCKNSSPKCFETTHLSLHTLEAYGFRLNSFLSTISQQNTDFNMYTETSKRQQGSPYKNPYPKFFKTINFD